MLAPDMKTAGQDVLDKQLRPPSDERGEAEGGSLDRQVI
jgi:hypothetical protein